ncbi:MAG: DNA-3-methyladenine glycosylase 2 family protein [Chloroflexales bacterium]|nr:DNA-3-methyladenine glycosylase 2 family protein [Chloroflexales bacterium]
MNTPSIDAAQAEAHLRAADPVMARVVAAVGACTLIPKPAGFATLVDAIVSQQISVKAADAIARRLEAAAGELAPPALMALGHDALRALGLSNAKARYVLDLSERVADGRLDLDHLARHDDEAIIEQLVLVKGIGRWTAEMYLIFSLNRPDVLPVDDLGLRQGVQRAYGLAELPKAPAIRLIAEPWRPFRSVGTWYLWRSGGDVPTV